MSDYHLPPEDVFRIAATVGKGAVVVGGQALNIWAELFSNQTDELNAYRPFTSKDMDYFGYLAAAAKLATELGGVLKLPTLDDATPNIALVEADLGGRKIVIDFIGSVLGVKYTNLENSTVELRVPFKFDGTTQELDLVLMHPAHCLQSRVANIVHPAMLRQDEASFRQLRSAIIVLREYVFDRLSVDDTKEASWTVRQFFAWLRGHEHARLIYTRHGIDLLETLRTIIAHPKWDERHRALVLSKMIDEIEDRRRRNSLMPPAQ